MDGLTSDFAIVPSHLSSRPGLQKLRFRLFRDRGSSSLQFPAPFVTSALFSVSSVYRLIRFGCGCFILFLAWLVVDARVSSRHDPSPARFGLTPHMDLIPHLNKQPGSPCPGVPLMRPSTPPKLSWIFKLDSTSSNLFSVFYSSHLSYL